MDMIRILLIEDNQADIDIIESYIQEKIDVTVKVEIIRDGTSAKTYVENSNDTTNIPHLILLDLTLPDFDGFELIRDFKTSDHLKRSPLFVVTSSEEEHAILKGYQLGINGFLTKPNDVDDYYEMICSLIEFWTKHARYPRQVG